jgi:phospholipid transport system substrate-binding protein
MSCKTYDVLRWTRGVALLVTVCALLCQADSLQAATDPLSQLKASVDKVLAVLKDKKLAGPEMRATRRQKVESLVDAIFDFQEMGKRALGRTWDKLAPAEKEEYVDLFARLVKQRYIGKIDSYSGQEIVFKRQVLKGRKALVYSVLLDNNTEIPIDYRLVLKNDLWAAYDLRIENVSLVANYRRDFASIVKKKGVAGLMKKMRDKVEQLEADQ